jgi:putative MATE family efflux protein
MKSQNDLTSGPIGRTLIRLTIPMVAGFAASMSFNLVDALFVAQLGTIPLAAMSFTFPVAMLIISVSVGISMGTAAVISRAYGKRDSGGVKRLTTASLLLGLLISVVFIGVGIPTIGPIFRALGATPDIIPLISQYMVIWYTGVPFIVIPMLGSSSIRATGDTKMPGLFMVTGALINVILDPIMIYGLFGFPRMELAGAALATVIGQGITLILVLAVLSRRLHLIDFSGISFAGIRRSWGEILRIGIPSAGTNLLFPFSMAFVTWLASRFGPEGVAAVGAGLRIESFAFVVIIGLSSALVPFVGQNWGALAFARVHEAQNKSNLFTFWWGLFCWVVFVVFSHPIGRLFSDDERVIRYIAYYLWIMPAGLSAQGIFQLISGTFNAMGRPLVSAGLNISRVVLFYGPLAWLGTVLFGFPGLIGGIAATNIVTGFIAILLFRHICVHDETCIKDGTRAVPPSGGGVN